MSLNKRTFSV